MFHPSRFLCPKKSCKRHLLDKKCWWQLNDENKLESLWYVGKAASLKVVGIVNIIEEDNKMIIKRITKNYNIPGVILITTLMLNMIIQYFPKIFKNI